MDHKTKYQRLDVQQWVYDLQPTINGHDSSIFRDLAIVYTNENWFEIPFVKDILGTEFPKYLTLVC